METTKKIAAQVYTTVRELVNATNNMEIRKDDIVTVLYVGAEYWLIYYK